MQHGVVFCFKVLGASWYLLSIEREDACWRKACRRNNGCEIDSLVCRQQNTQNNNFLATDCPISSTQNSTSFDFGIFLPALQNVVHSEKFLEKFFYCFWWGLQNLRQYTTFPILICEILCCFCNFTYIYHLSMTIVLIIYLCIWHNV